MSTSKIQAQHLSRKACVYLRQSTLAQLSANTESTARQYALRDRALELGWSARQVEVIDEDLGRSGQSSKERSGFQHLAEDIAHGRVGAIFAIEVSRLARSSTDWYRLLELCSLADVLIIDDNTVYSPHADYNDKMLLGFKGQMSEAEAYWIKLRLHGAKLAKARRGELKFRLPAGLAWRGDKIDLHPDESIRKTITLVFERFRIDGSIIGVTRHFARLGIRIPCRCADSSIRWDRASVRNIGSTLKSPFYAGAYAYGRRPLRIRLTDGEPRRSRGAVGPIDEWPICIKDSHPGYISWDEFLENQRKMRQNMSDSQYPDQHGTPRNGTGLLQGLALCGKCGERMRMRYLGRTNFSYYSCERSRMHGGGSCWTVTTRAIDSAVEELFLKTMQPSEIDLSLAVVRQVEQQAQEAGEHWKMRLERARYEARQAERRYRAVDAENRLVARTLEQDWEERLRELAEVEQELERARHQHRLEITEGDRKAIVALARDLPRVWQASSTTQADRKALLRMAIRDVVLRPIDVPTRTTSVQVIWHTGVVSELVVKRSGRGKYIETAPEAMTIIKELCEQHKSDSAIAIELNQRGLRTGTGLVWNKDRVFAARMGHNMRKGARKAQLPDQREDGAYSVVGLARKLGVSDRIIYAWQRTGRLKGEREGNRNSPWWFKLSDEELGRLQRKAN